MIALPAARRRLLRAGAGDGRTAGGGRLPPCSEEPAVLRSLSREHTTSELAADLEISLASVSGHTKTLRAAGLIVSDRDGKSVWHSVTPLGAMLRQG